jgi:hypothetical protein
MRDEISSSEASWPEEELSAATLPDKRLTRRLRRLLDQLSAARLVTNLPVKDLSAAVEKLGWYALRCKAEVFHKGMKSGCRAEEARLETAERLAKFLVLIVVVDQRLRHLTTERPLRPRCPAEPRMTRRSRSSWAQPPPTPSGPIPVEDCPQDIEEPDHRGTHNPGAVPRSCGTSPDCGPCRYQQ